MTQNGDGPVKETSNEWQGDAALCELQTQLERTLKKLDEYKGLEITAIRLDEAINSLSTITGAKRSSSFKLFDEDLEQ